MKKSYLFLLTIILVGCHPKIQNPPITQQQLEAGFDKYQVYKIDSVKNLYILYARKNNIPYKIVSLKLDSFDCRNIRVGGEYPFGLFSLVPDAVGGHDMGMVNSHISGIDYYGTSVLFERDSINNIFFAKNIKGLCFIKK